MYMALSHKSIHETIASREGNSPIIGSVRDGLEAGSIGDVDRIARRVARSRDLLQVAIVQVVGWEGLAREEFRGLDDGGRQTHLGAVQSVSLESVG